MEVKNEGEASCLFQKVASQSDKEWSVYEDGGRVIVECEDVFKCFISKAYEVKSRKRVLSAHMLLYAGVDSLSRLQFWAPGSLEQDEAVLKNIFRDLRNIKTYCSSITCR